MSSHKKSSDTYAVPSGKLSLLLDLKKSSKRPSKTVKEVVLPATAEKKSKAQSCVNQSYSELPGELRHVKDGILVQPKPSGNHQQQSVMAKPKDDELVKYMSNLPDYLQRMERGENTQGMAFNVGVLDWALLEKWKCSHKYLESDGNNASRINSKLSNKTTMRSSTFSSAVHCKTPYQRVRHPSDCSGPNPSQNDSISRGVKLSKQNVACFQDFEKTSKGSLDGQHRVLGTYQSFGRNSSDAILYRGKKKHFEPNITSKLEHLSSNLRCDGILIKHEEDVRACDGEAKKRVEDIQESDKKRKVLHRKIASRVKASSSKPRSYDASLNSEEKRNVSYVDTEKRTEKLQDLAIDLSPQHQPGESKNIVLLLPNKLSPISSYAEPRTSLGENLKEADQDNSSDGFSQEEIHSSELRCEIPRSCPLPPRDEINTEPHNMVYTVIKTQDSEPSSKGRQASEFFHEMPTTPSSIEHVEKNNVKATNGYAVEASKVTDQETTELVAKKGRHPSPNRRFSFSLSRMTRSFSFKESSAPPELSSTYVSIKSGPVSSCSDNSNRDRVSDRNRARSSPLRRILDPLLKSKCSTPLHSAETKPPLKGLLRSFSFKPSNVIESLQNDRHEASIVQGLLHLTSRNGLPLFKFVVKHKTNILAAPIKSLTSSRKNDSGYNYVFYTIDEIKKRSGSWINQGSKEKSSGYIYNVVGQMKVNTASFFNLTGQNVSQCMEKESVLFGVEPRHADQASPNFMSNRELAAVVVKTPVNNLSCDAQKNDEDLKEKGLSQGLPKNGSSCNLGENEHSCSAIVILPDGIHTLPIKGAPSPLIHRWKSGGSCDCGGWDVGCKLRILFNENRSCKTPRTSEACSTSDHFQLFIEGRAQKDKPVFSMVTMEKGTYSVEFSPSISLLQAFFICVNVISCQKSSELVEASNLSEENFFQEPSNPNHGTKKIRTVVLGETPFRYTPGPPMSPVGRV